MENKYVSYKGRILKVESIKNNICTFEDKTVACVSDVKFINADDFANKISLALHKLPYRLIKLKDQECFHCIIDFPKDIVKEHFEFKELLLYMKSLHYEYDSNNKSFVHECCWCEEYISPYDNLIRGNCYERVSLDWIYKCNGKFYILNGLPLCESPNLLLGYMYSLARVLNPEEGYERVEISACKEVQFWRPGYSYVWDYSIERDSSTIRIDIKPRISLYDDYVNYEILFSDRYTKETYSIERCLDILSSFCRENFYSRFYDSTIENFDCMKSVNGIVALLEYAIRYSIDCSKLGICCFCLIEDDLYLVDSESVTCIDNEESFEGLFDVFYWCLERFCEMTGIYIYQACILVNTDVAFNKNCYLQIKDDVAYLVYR